MHFSSTSTNFSLSFDDGGIWLVCDCQTEVAYSDGKPALIRNKFPLHDNFYAARGDSPMLRYGTKWGYRLTDADHVDRYSARLTGGTIFTVPVRLDSGRWANASMCLDFFLTNSLGVLMCNELLVDSTDPETPQALTVSVQIAKPLRQRGHAQSLANLRQQHGALASQPDWALHWPRRPAASQQHRPETFTTRTTTAFSKENGTATLGTRPRTAVSTLMAISTVP